MTKVPKKWRDRFALIPHGYDPVATAGDCVFVESDADHAIDWIENVCRHVKGEHGGKLFVLEDWQKAMTGCLFGWRRKDGTRRYREMFLFVPRKNGKSAWAAAVRV